MAINLINSNYCMQSSLLVGPLLDFCLLPDIMMESWLAHHALRINVREQDVFRTMMLSGNGLNCMLHNLWILILLLNRAPVPLPNHLCMSQLRVLKPRYWFDWNQSQLACFGLFFLFHGWIHRKITPLPNPPLTTVHMLRVLITAAQRNITITIISADLFFRIFCIYWGL